MCSQEFHQDRVLYGYGASISGILYAWDEYREKSDKVKKLIFQDFFA